jgi:hypothetical protein
LSALVFSMCWTGSPAHFPSWWIRSGTTPTVMHEAGSDLSAPR